MNIARYTLTGLLCVILAIALGSAGLVTSATQDFSDLNYIFMLMLLLLAILVPLLNFLHRDRFRAGGIVLSIIFLALWGGLGLLIAGWLDSRWLYIFWVLLITAVPGGVALLMRTKPWGNVFAWMVCGFSIICTILGVLGVWMEWSSLILFATVLMIHGAIIGVLLINVGRGDHRYFRWPGVVLALAALLLLVRFGVGTLSDGPAEVNYRAIFYSELCAIAAGTLAMINLVLMTARPGLVRLFQVSTIILTALSGGLLLLFMIIGEVNSSAMRNDAGSHSYLQFVPRCMLASMILASGSLLALFVARAMLRIAQQPVPFAAERLQLICPNCGTSALMPMKGKCPKCLLEFRIVLSEPRCPACQHLLLNLQSSRCTECGTPVERPGEVHVPEVPVASLPPPAG